MDRPGDEVRADAAEEVVFHREITGKGYKCLRPGTETTFYDAKCVQVIDPFGNRIRFNEDLKTDGAK